ncbi:hypothetical protein ORV05_04025 [Amycolatopsis cynarae]|uniref:Methyltransferase n=1 Tax=Amycolatopsis cynarae TaxID=2995223 RepID=A0ABY7B4W1_9PSEU|nr:hypothetical protein [Amycolatopsis sp. HUAS 11-8]WAL66974.1 hypothetical protein ORV05_04025 [Amycolatopsis sp. HUAS 11-8]
MIRRWDYTPEMWHDQLTQHGFTDVETTVIPGPEGAAKPTDTMLVHGRRPASFR